MGWDVSSGPGCGRSVSAPLLCSGMIGLIQVFMAVTFSGADAARDNVEVGGGHRVETRC